MQSCMDVGRLRIVYVGSGDYFESRLGLSHHAATQSAASFFHSLPGGNHSSLLSRPAPILLDLDQDRDIGDDGKGASTSPFGHLKRDHSAANVVGGLGKQGEPRGVNHFATERQRREFLNEKYQTLRSLVPNPTKVLSIRWCCFFQYDAVDSSKKMVLILSFQCCRFFHYDLVDSSITKGVHPLNTMVLASFNMMLLILLMRWC